VFRTEKWPQLFGNASQTVYESVIYEVKKRRYVNCTWELKRHVVELGEIRCCPLQACARKCIIFTKVVMHKSDTFQYQTPAYLCRRRLLGSDL